MQPQSLIKTLILSIAIFCLAWSCPLSAQTEWAPIGAQWDYGKYFSETPSEISWHKVIVEKDTVLNSIQCRKLIQTNTNALGSVSEKNLFTYERNDSVFYYYPSIDSFLLSYDFTAVEGDTIVLPQVELQYEILLRLDSISVFTTNNGVELNKYHYSHISGPLPYYSLLEGIGHPNGILPFAGYFSGEFPVEELRCFNSDTLEYSNTDQCEFYGIVNQLDYPAIEALNIFPNPAAHSIKIETENTGSFNQLNIYNANGFRVKHELNVRNNAAINVEDLSPGIYFVEVLTGDTSWKTRLVKI